MINSADYYCPFLLFDFILLCIKSSTRMWSVPLRLNFKRNKGISSARESRDKASSCHFNKTIMCSTATNFFSLYIIINLKSQATYMRFDFWGTEREGDRKWKPANKDHHDKSGLKLWGIFNLRQRCGEFREDKRERTVNGERAANKADTTC